METFKHLIDPVSHNPRGRTVFKLPKARIAGNICLARVGIAGHAENLSSRAGIFEFITNIAILHNGQLISELRNPGYWMGFKNVLGGNTRARDVAYYANGNNTSFKILEGKSHVQSVHNNVAQVAADEANPTTYIRLANVLPFLLACMKTKTVIPAHKMDLELVIDFGNFTDPAQQAMRPIMVVTEVTNSTVDTFDIAYEHIRGDIFHLPATADGTHQQVDYRLRGLEGHFISKLMIMNTGATTYGDRAINGVHHYGASAQHLEKYRIKINGRTVLPFGELDEVMQQRLQFETFGSFHQPIMANRQISAAPFRAHLYEAEARNIVGSYGYSCIEIDETVDEFEVSYERTGLAAAVLREAKQQRYFAVCYRKASFNKGGQLVIADM